MIEMRIPIVADDFAAAVEPHRRELHVHAYRILGSFLYAWTPSRRRFSVLGGSRGSFDGPSAFRAWLYRNATNVCLDAIRWTNRRPQTDHWSPWGSALAAAVS
jgi:RNA polymerase sigma-70 factor (ECF subfamily)